MAGPQGVVRDGQVSMVTTTGEVEQVPLANIQDAYQRGWKPEAADALTARERRESVQGAGQTALTAVEGAASGLTGGMSDRVLVHALGEEYRDKASARAEVHDTARLLGEVGGGIGLGIATGGVSSFAAKALAGTGRGVVARALGAAAQGALEGGLFAAGQVNADAALGGTEITAEQLLSAVGDGALWGGVGGGLFGGAAAGAGKAGDYVASRMTNGATMREALQEVVQKRLVQKAAPGISPERAQALGEKMLKANISAADDLGKIATRVDEMAGASAANLQKVAAAADNLGIKIAPKQVLAAVDDRIAKLADSPSTARLAKKLEREIKPLREAAAAGQDLPIQELVQIRTRLAAAPAKGAQAEVKRTAVEALDSTLGEALDQADDQLHVRASQGDPQARDMVAARRDAKDALRQAVTDVDDWAELQRAAKQPAPAAIRSEMPGASSMLGVITGIATGNVGLGAVAALAGNKAVSAATNYVAQRGVGAVTRLSERLAKAGVRLDQAAQAMVTGGTTAASKGAAALSYEDIRERVKSVQSGQGLAPMAEDLADQPELAMQVQRTVIGDATYLEKRFPQAFSRGANTITPQATKTTISDVDRRKVERIASALDNPAGTFERIAAGTATPEEIEALRARRPELWRTVRESVIVYAAERGDELKFSRRNWLGQVFDFPADWSLVPRNTTAIQNVPTAEGPAPGASQKPSGSANISRDVARSFALPSNPVESP